MDKMRKISSVMVSVAMVATVVLLVQVTMNVNDGNLDMENEMPFEDGQTEEEISKEMEETENHDDLDELLKNEMPFEDGRTEEEIYKEIEETESKILVVDKIIGDRHVKYWEHIIDGIYVKNDFILLHTDIDNGEIVYYERCWTDVGPLSDPKSESFAPENYYWKQAVVFYDEDDCTYFYTFYDSQEYPLACWEVRHDDGTTVMYDFDGNEIGYGIPAPANGFSLSGYNNATWPDPWLPHRQNADLYFSNWCSSTTSLSMPSASTISTYVSDPDYKLFYELAHGGSYSFLADSTSSYFSDSGANNVQDDMASRKRMKLAFIGSCEGLDDTGPGSFSYEFRKGETAGTVTIGFDGMASCPGWPLELDWQDYMFDKMDDGHTMKASFDLANANYPTIASCVVFVGDESLIAGNNPPIAGMDGPYFGEEGSPIYFDASGSYDPDCNTLEYRWDYQSDGTWTAWSTVPTSSHVYGDDWVGMVTLEVREKFTSDQFTDSLTMSVTVNNVAPIVDPLPVAAINEGDTVLFVGHATDPGSDDLEFTWDWGYPPFGQTVNTYLNNPPSPDPYPSKDINPRDVTDTASQTYGDNGIYPITLTVVDDDGGTTTVTMNLTVNNVVPTIQDVEAYIYINFTLRAAGEKWHNVNMSILVDGTEIAFAEVIRYPGSPDDQSKTIYGVKCDVTKVIEVKVLYTPMDDPPNGQIWGATPVWVTMDFEDGEDVRLHHTCNVRHPDTWEWTFGVNEYIVAHEITFEASATDPGSDDLTFTWDWDDPSADDVTPYYNDGTNPDSYPSPGPTYPCAASDTKGHTFLASGNYNVELTVDDDDGGWDSIILPIILS